MVYPNDLEVRLGFDQIRLRLLNNCLGDLGKKRVLEMILLTELPSIQSLLFHCKETKTLRDRGEDFPLHVYDDPTPWVQLIALEGSYLEAVAFSRLADTFKMIQDANTFLHKDPETQPNLFHSALPIGFGKRITEAIRSKVDEEGVVKDNASPSLSRIRKRFREEERKVRRVADQIMRHVWEQGWSPEGANPTIRDGRLVIPIAAEHKRRIKGYIVDQSATGQTVYLEPAEVLEANNDLRDLGLEEQKEVIRILRELTFLMQTHLPDIQQGCEFLGLLDFNRAKAILAQDFSAGLPRIQNSAAMDWKDARHPLLFLSLKNKRPIVPLSMQLSEENRFLLVSGPNAGGKSVCLKTVGLIQYMLQCGLLVPMDEGSTVGIFENIFLDIGDQQSIESDLSTYSSHLKNMDYFIRYCDGRTLILIDELGSGTDPNFGGGIAQAVLEQLLTKEAWGIATTHYYNLKVFASNYRGIRNASMQFDAKKLMPLYRLEIGQPGSSFALEIARKTGLPLETLEAAGRIIGKELMGLETLMKEVAEDKVRIAEQDKEVRDRAGKLESTLRHYEELVGNLELQKKEILNRAKAEASTLLQETNREIEKTIRHIRENKAEGTETRKVRQSLRELVKKVTPLQPVTTRPVGLLVPGDKVRMIGGEVTGTVLSAKGKTAVVQFGDLRSTVKFDRLVRSEQVDKTSAARPRVGSISFMGRQSEFSPLLDIRGKRVEEVLPLLERFMDDAVRFGLQQVRILHGKGEGVLRKVSRDYLKGLKTVASFRDEHPDRGGDGITWVYLH